MQLPFIVYAGFILSAFFGFVYKWGDFTKKLSTQAITLSKGLATLSISLIALFQPGVYAKLVFAALVICAIADMALEKNFIAGMIIFALGHFVYIAGFLYQNPFDTRLLLPYALLFIFQLCISYLAKKELKALRYPVLFYGMILSASFVCALSKNTAAAVGALLFLVSDCFILYRLIKKPSKLNEIGCISLYYLGQFILALSSVLS